jgi:hypothetical protein
MRRQRAAATFIDTLIRGLHVIRPRRLTFVAVLALGVLASGCASSEMSEADKAEAKPVFEEYYNRCYNDLTLDPQAVYELAMDELMEGRLNVTVVTARKGGCEAGRLARTGGGPDSSSIAETTTDPPASNVEATDRCSDAEFAAAQMPYSQQLHDSLAAVAAAGLQDAAALTEAGSRLVMAGANLERVARDTPPCSPRMKEAQPLVTGAGASAVYAGLETQEAADRISAGNTAAASRTIRRANKDLAAMSSKLREATPLIAGESESVPEAPEADTSPGIGDIATGSDWGFMTPSQNIACNSGPHNESTLSCVVFSESTAAQGQKVWRLEDSGRPTTAIVMANIGTDVPTLDYGRTWKRGPLSCVSRSTGLTCQNHEGHGFELSRERQRVS